jgi:hypothetical protein
VVSAEFHFGGLVEGVEDLCFRWCLASNIMIDITLVVACQEVRIHIGAITAASATVAKERLRIEYGIRSRGSTWILMIRELQGGGSGGGT